MKSIIIDPFISYDKNVLFRLEHAAGIGGFNLLYNKLIRNWALSRIGDVCFLMK